MKGGFLEAERRIRRQYFGLGGRPPTYDDTDVQRRFRMPRSLFLRIYNDIEDKPWWVQRPNATGHMQAHSLQKLVGALRVPSYGDAEDRNDDSVEMSKTTVHEAMTRFISFILEKYEPSCLRAPTMAGLKRIMERDADRGLRGCIGRLDWCHWRYTECPVAMRGIYLKNGRERQRTIVIETVCNRDMWVWNIFAGSPGSNNDLNVLAQSPLMVKANHGEWPPRGLQFTVNDSSFHCPYYLVDGIGPRFWLLVSPHPKPSAPRERTLNRLQDALRKDVERL